MTHQSSHALLAGRFGDAAAVLSEQIQRGVGVVHSHRGGVGAGTLWADGLLVTNHHVASADSATVVFQDGREREARVVARDSSVDLAALEVESDGYTPLPTGDFDRLRVGQVVLAVGNPLGERRAVTAGIISAVGGDIAGGPLRLRAAVHANITLLPGNSGGPLADVSGCVIGINSFVMGPSVAVAVPSNSVARFVHEQAPGAAVLGVAGQSVQLPGQPPLAGVLVSEVVGASAAERAGLLVGDVLLAIDDTPTPTGDHVLRALGSRHAGVARTLAILRGGIRQELIATPQRRAA